MTEELARLRWQCRRGMRELDQLLGAYLDTQYPQASDAEKAVFEQILGLPDPELAGYFLGRQVPGDTAIAKGIERILGRD